MESLFLLQLRSDHEGVPLTASDDAESHPEFSSSSVTVYAPHPKSTRNETEAQRAEDGHGRIDDVLVVLRHRQGSAFVCLGIVCE